jgi:hypothetical protein
MKQVNRGSAAALDDSAEKGETTSESPADFRLVSGSGPNILRRYRSVLLGVVILAIAGALAAAFLPRNTDGFLRVESRPEGLVVRIDDEVRGKTPLFLPLTPRQFDVVVGEGETATKQRVSLRAGERASLYHIDARLDAVGTAPGSGTGSSDLSVTTEPAGGRVLIDGVDRGTAPLVVHGLAGGEHHVNVKMDAPALPPAPATAAAPRTGASGWLTVRAPLVLQVREGERVIGSTDAERLVLAEGDHTLTFSSDAAGFRISQPVRIVPRQTVALTLQVPQVPVNVNATPWAEVWIDGERIGETPIANHLLTPGNHQFELRHSQLGTKRVNMFISLNRINRVTVDMREEAAR